MEKVAHFFSFKTPKLRGIVTGEFLIFNHKLLINSKVILLVLILCLASFLRLYKISDYMTFLGDEGRDVLVAYDILHGNLTLLGPRSSAADFFYGPIYYYFITPFLFLFNYDPVGPAIFVALLGIATVYLVYRFGREFINVEAGLFAAALYAVSSLVIAYSRSSWNPNPLPFVSLLILYLLTKYIASPSLKAFLISGILLGVAMQLQYLALFLSIIIVVYLFVGTWHAFKKIDIFLTLKRYLTVFIGFLIGFSPFLMFEVRHSFPNITTLLKYILTDELDPVDAEVKPFFPTVLETLFRLFGRLVTRFPPPEQINVLVNEGLFIWYAATLLLLIASIVFLFKIKRIQTRILLSLWLLLGVGLFGFYKDEIFDYHFGFMFPLPFLLAGNAFGEILRLNKFKRFFGYASLLAFLFLFLFNLSGNPFTYIPNKQKEQVKKISDFVLSKTDGKPFNFALLTLGNSDHAYRYFFKLVKRDPVTIESLEKDPERKTVTNQLLVVCEDQDCHPLGASLWEVAGFGRAEIIGEWSVSVVKVYKLVHYHE